MILEGFVVFGKQIRGDRRMGDLGGIKVEEEENSYHKSTRNSGEH